MLPAMLLLAAAAALSGWWLLRSRDKQALNSRNKDYLAPEVLVTDVEPPELVTYGRGQLELEISKLVRRMDEPTEDLEIPAFLRRQNARLPKRSFDDSASESEESQKWAGIAERLRRISERSDVDDALAEDSEMGVAADVSRPATERPAPLPMLATPRVAATPRVSVQAQESTLVSAPMVEANGSPKPSTPVNKTEPKKSDPLVADHSLGRIYFDPPKAMMEGEVTEMFALIVAPSHVDRISFAVVTSSKRTPEIAEVAAPGLMYARVYADPVALQVIALGNDLVNVQSALGYGQWQWRVRALQPGNHKMTLRISHARPIVGGGGVYAEDVVALNRDILISVSKSRVARGWLLSAAGVLIGAAVGQLVEDAAPTLRDSAYGLFGSAPDSGSAGLDKPPAASPQP